MLVSLRPFLLIAALVVPFAGCGNETVSTPSQDELSQYVEENPSDFTGNEDIGGGDTAN